MLLRNVLGLNVLWVAMKVAITDSDEASTAMMAFLRGRNQGDDFAGHRWKPIAKMELRRHASEPD